MSNAIQFLASLGSNPVSVRYSEEAYASAVASLELDAAQRSALLARDPTALNGALGGRGQMCSAVFTPDEDLNETPE